MKVMYAHLTLFVCPEKGATTSDISEAVQWCLEGFKVFVLYNSQYVGVAKNGGIFQKVSDIPDDLPHGAICFCRETDTFIVNVQGDLLDKACCEGD